jgi:hypothetical protein
MLVRVCNRLVETSSEGFKGAFVCWLLERKCAENFARWCTMMGVQDVTDPSDMHCTLAYSPEVGVPAELLGDRPLEYPYATGYHYAPTSPRKTSILGKTGSDGALVVELQSPVLAMRHIHYRDEVGLPYGFPEYRPHVSMSYSAMTQSAEVRNNVVRNPCPLPLVFDTERVSYCN